MLPGKGHAKGASFERKIGRELSFWISHGERGDLFTRNVLSGGDFTRRIATQETEVGTPGDLMARNPLAFDFARAFAVECKHYRDLGMLQFLTDETETSFLSKVLTHTRLQADQAGVHFMVIARQNRMGVLVILPRRLGELVLVTAAPRKQLIAHQLHGRYFLTTLDCLIALVPPEVFIADALGMLRVQRRPPSLVN
jgi:hypothetical protein